MKQRVRYFEYIFASEKGQKNMHPKMLANDLCRSLRSCTIIPITINDPICANGHNLESLRLDLIQRHEDGSIDYAGVYIIGNNLDVLKIGEGGNKGMGNRVFRQIDRDWMLKRQQFVLFG